MPLISEVTSPGPGSDITAALQAAVAASPWVVLNGSGLIGATIAIPPGGRLTGVGDPVLTLTADTTAITLDGGGTLEGVGVNGWRADYDSGRLLPGGAVDRYIHARTLPGGGAAAGALVRAFGRATLRHVRLTGIGKYGFRLGLVDDILIEDCTADNGAGHAGVAGGAVHMLYCTGASVPGGVVTLRRYRATDTPKHIKRWGCGGAFFASGFGSPPYMPTQVIVEDSYLDCLGAEVDLGGGNFDFIGALDFYINCPRSRVTNTRVERFVHIGLKLGAAGDCLADRNIVESALEQDPAQAAATGVADVGPRQAISWQPSFPAHQQMHHGFTARHNTIKAGREGIACFGRAEVRDQSGNVTTARIAARGVRLEGNEIAGVTGAGILLRDVESPEISGNRTDDCGSHGVDGQRVSGNPRVLAHRAAGCGGRGVHLVGLGAGDAEVRGLTAHEFRGNAAASVDGFERMIVNDGHARVAAGTGKAAVRGSGNRRHVESRGFTAVIPGGTKLAVAAPTVAGGTSRLEP